MSKINTSSKQVRKNLYSNIVFLCCNVFVGIYYTPYLVKELGAIVYGILPLALVVNQYITVFTASITGALSRFLSISIQRREYKKGSSYMSSSLISIVFFIVLLSPLFIYFICNLDVVFNISKDLLYSARILFTCTIISFFISLFCSIFNISQYSYNRLDLINITRSIRTILRLILIICFFEFVRVDIVFVGYVSLIVETLVLLLSLTFFKKETKGLVKISYKYFDKTSLFAVLGMTGWTMLHVFGDVTLYQMDVYFLNKFFGTKISGIFGAFSSFGSYVIQIVSVVSSLFGPLILVAYSSNNHKDVQKLAMHTSVIVGGISASIIGIIIGFSKQFISVWLNPEFALYRAWMIVKLSWIPFYASAGVYAYLFRAHNKVKKPALVTLGLGVLNVLVVSYLYTLNRSDISFVVIALCVTAVLSFFQSYLFGVFWFDKIYPGNKRTLIVNSIVILFALLMSSCVGWGLNKIEVTTLFPLLLLMASGALINIIVIYFLIFRREQRKIFKQILIR